MLVARTSDCLGVWVSRLVMPRASTNAMLGPASGIGETSEVHNIAIRRLVVCCAASYCDWLAQQQRQQHPSEFQSISSP